MKVALNSSIIRLIFILIYGLFISQAKIYAQTFEIVSPLTYSGELSPEEICYDLNESPCAMIVVNVPLRDVSITGSYILNNFETDNGKYKVNVSVPKRKGQKITLKHNDYESLEIPLWCDGEHLKEGCYYTIDIATKDRTLYSKRKIDVWSVQDVITKAVTGYKSENSIWFLSEGIGWKELKERYVDFPTNILGDRIYRFPNMDDFLLESGMNDVKSRLGFYTATTNISNRFIGESYDCILFILGSCMACVDGAVVYIQIPSLNSVSLLDTIGNDLKGILIGTSKGNGQSRYVYGMAEDMYLYVVVRDSTTTIFISTDNNLYKGPLNMQYGKHTTDINQFLGIDTSNCIEK